MRHHRRFLGLLLAIVALPAGAADVRIRPFEETRNMPSPVVVLTGTTSAPEVLTEKQHGYTFLATGGSFGALLPGADGDTAIEYTFLCGSSGSVTIFPFGTDTITLGDGASAGGLGSGTGAGGFVEITGEGRSIRLQSSASGVWTVTALAGSAQFGDNWGAAAAHVRGGLEALRRAVPVVMGTGSASSAPASHELGLSFAAGATNDAHGVAILPPDWDGGLDVDTDFVTLYVHYIKTTSAAGTVKWETRYRLADATRDLSAWSSWTGTSNLAAHGDTADRQAIDYSADIAVTSTSRVPARAMAVQVRRVSSGGSADTYAAAAILLGVSVYYSSDIAGERADFTK